MRRAVADTTRRGRLARVGLAVTPSGLVKAGSGFSMPPPISYGQSPVSGSFQVPGGMPAHTHQHDALLGLGDDDHVQYALAGASRAGTISVEAASAINQDLTTDSVTAALAGLTLGNQGLHLLDTNASHDLIVKPGSDLSADRILTITTGDAARTITLEADSILGQDYSTDAGPTFNHLHLGGAQALFFGGGSLISLDFIQTVIGENVYFSAGWKRVGIGIPALYEQISGVHVWYNAITGIADSAITWIQLMALSAAGILSVAGGLRVNHIQEATGAHMVTFDNEALFSANLRVGTYAVKAAEVHTGYITIKDAGGTERKVMVCA